MLDSLITYLHTAALFAGPLGVFLLSFLQELIPPIPSTLVTLSVGFFFMGDAAITGASMWRLFLYVGLPVSVGLTLGSLMIYGIVYWGGRPVVERFGKYIGITLADIDRLNAYLTGRKYDDVLLFLARSFPLMPSSVLNIFCGLVRWSPVSFFWNTFIGTIIRSMWSGFIGWQVGVVYEAYAARIESFQNILFILAIVAIALFVYIRRRKSRIVNRES
ncbi:MAG: VTT domain-containing protein [Patescibacteria group bacterium]